MTYTSEHARKEVGNSIDWKVGFQASLKKWELIASGKISRGNYYSDGYGDSCGFCFVGANLNLPPGACSLCPARDLCWKRDDLSPKMIRHRLRQLGKRKGWL